jgi:hypothetical protein
MYVCGLYIDDVQLLHKIFLIYDQCTYSPLNRYTDDFIFASRSKYMYVCICRCVYIYVCMYVVCRFELVNEADAGLKHPFMVPIIPKTGHFMKIH